VKKIDIVQYSQDQAKFVKATLSPAEGISVKFNEDKTEVVVTVPEDQLSLAIGRGGQNVKLAAKITNLKIKIISDKTDPGIVVTGDEELEISGDQKDAEKSNAENIDTSNWLISKKMKDYRDEEKNV